MRTVCTSFKIIEKLQFENKGTINTHEGLAEMPDPINKFHGDSIHSSFVLFRVLS